MARVDHGIGLAVGSGMKVLISQGGETTELELPEGEIQIGSAESDGLRIEGIEPTLALLTVEGDSLLVTPWRALKVEGSTIPERTARLLLANETLTLAPDVTLRRLSGAAGGPPTSTCFVLKDMLARPQSFDGGAGAWLTCVVGLDLGKRFPLAESEMLMGRGEDCAIRVRDRAVSRRHARIRKDGLAFTIEDLGSPNGILVAGEVLHGTRTLHDGEVVEIGHSSFRFSSPQTPQPLQPTAPSEDESPAEPRRHPLGSKIELACVAALMGLAAVGGLAVWKSVGLDPSGGQARSLDKQGDQLPMLLEEAGEVQKAALATNGINSDRPR